MLPCESGECGGVELEIVIKQCANKNDVLRSEGVSAAGLVAGMVEYLTRVSC